MSIPGFTADVSLAPSTRRYRGRYGSDSRTGPLTVASTGGSCTCDESAVDTSADDMPALEFLNDVGAPEAELLDGSDEIGIEDPAAVDYFDLVDADSSAESE